MITQQRKIRLKSTYKNPLAEKLRAKHKNNMFQTKSLFNKKSEKLLEENIKSKKF
jgi:hypothetical protein